MPMSKTRKEEINEGEPMNAEKRRETTTNRRKSTRADSVWGERSVEEEWPNAFGTLVDNRRTEKVHKLDLLMIHSCLVVLDLIGQSSGNCINSVLHIQSNHSHR